MYYNDRKEKKHNLFKQKVIALHRWSFEGHTNEIKKLFEDFNKSERCKLSQRLKPREYGYDDDDDDNQWGQYDFDIFGVLVYCDGRGIGSLKYNIRREIKELEANDIGKKMIEIALKENEKYENDLKAIQRFYFLKLEENDIKYSHILRSLFPLNEYFTLSKEQFISKLQSIQFFKDENIDNIYHTITHKTYGIVYKDNQSYKLMDIKSDSGKIMFKSGISYGSELQFYILNSQNRKLNIL